ncbi:ferritin-like domain-containing protein [Adhaeribacter soli]|uniref:Iminophenyl-pyruvate dimer synthase domain-containing protein n=1 Tax=Adhaeribacter soli TaxID=2607655 RepID=A0A5N1J2X1_9BACT|nr:ferritin-like domain-containing protein [Adhaeribacter soli]KAA9338982.1 hypothetical protein F0P94_09330 [Adhaeribacter soli]
MEKPTKKSDLLDRDPKQLEADLYDQDTEHFNPELYDRDPKHFETDKAALRLLLQAAVNVELFTIPLYMTALYSLQGRHQITGNNNLYEGRLWPGLAPSFQPGKSVGKNIKENEEAFNTIFSVFIEEMLHLQLASNLANALGTTPKFTYLSPGPGYAWLCYGEENTIIPHIIDFKDCEYRRPENWNPDQPEVKIDYSKIRVKLGELDQRQNDLFLAIEAPEDYARARIKPEYESKYLHTAPLKNWRPGVQLPMFGSIGMLYQIIWDYLDITYKDEEGNITTLFEKMYSPGAVQRDIFNTASPSHPYREYQGIETTVAGWLPEKAKNEIIYKLICAITDQGEGAGIRKRIRKASFGLQAVKPDYQPSEVALKADYPSYTDTGKPAPSSHAAARFGNGAEDHFERFTRIREDLGDPENGIPNKILTWSEWHKTNTWQAADFMVEGAAYKPPLPRPEEIAAAMNRLKNDPQKREENYLQFCEIATGAIAGITTVLDKYWADSSVGFPFPSMGGSGDRIMMCWAVFGQLPDLSVPVKVRDTSGKTLYHACQGIYLGQDKDQTDVTCASPEIYHNCRGSNSCKAEGGCGFVQKVGESKSCGQSVHFQKVAQPVLCGGPTPKPQKETLYSAPGDNICASYGGCAVPISASQIYPVIQQATSPDENDVTSGIMELNDYAIDWRTGEYTTVNLDGDTIPFGTGELVYKIAWDAYAAVMKKRDPNWSENPPATSDVRMVFPPST